MNPMRLLNSAGAYWAFRIFVCTASSFLVVSRAFTQGYSPQEAVSHMTVSQGFEVNLYASEPMITQPVCIEFDDRGRLWVIQYLQYPNPAGLHRAKVDRWSRTVYDRVPEPPPRGPRGADRITILEDPDGHGRASRAHDFVNGLNLASGIAFGHGGVFVLNVPYLLFYPDRNRDDVPDSDPEVLLTGFGMEDAHSVANSLTWGPDGWLYGCQGSTVTAHVRGLEFQQGVWRYHPVSRRFELFCEGGGNSWGLDFDEDGNLFYSTNFGEYRMLHGVQGAYYWKAFGKHGALHNPYAFGYFDHVPHRNFHGGHVTTGGIIYQGTSFPQLFRGKYIAGDLLGHQVQWHSMEPWGSTFKSAHGGELLIPNDLWSAPCDLTMGPDGAVYVADWFDQRTAHPDPDADWDRSNGRIYRIQASDRMSSSLQPDLLRLSSEQLVARLGDRNDWIVRKARRILADRRDKKVIPLLRRLVLESTEDHLALESLWALYVSGGFDNSVAEKTLAHRAPQIRWWTVRLSGDENRVSARLAGRLIKLAATDPDVRVRCQLACTAKRLPPELGLPIIQQLAVRNLDKQDPYVPLLLWWAVERHATNAIQQVLNEFASPDAWQTPLIHDAILERLMRRYAAEGTERCYEACAKLLDSAPSPEDKHLMLVALEQGFHDRPSGANGPAQGGLFEKEALIERKSEVKTAPPQIIPRALYQQILALWSKDTTDAPLISLATRCAIPSGLDRALSLAGDLHSPQQLRLAMIKLLPEVPQTEAVPLCLRLLDREEAEPIQLTALATLQGFDSEEIAATLLQRYPGWSDPVRSKARELLLGRKSWALAFLEKIDAGTFPAGDVPIEQLRLVALHQDKALDTLVTRNWGNVKGGTVEEKLAEMRRFNNDLNAGKGDAARGHELFRNLCAGCHRLYNEGDPVGPDLTSANRKDREFLLGSLVDPSALIRKEYVSYNVLTRDGSVLTGLIGEQSPSSITLVSAKNQRTNIGRDRIASMEESQVSLMPEGLLNPLKPSELRDLFSYLQGDRPNVVEK